MKKIFFIFWYDHLVREGSWKVIFDGKKFWIFTGFFTFWNSVRWVNVTGKHGHREHQNGADGCK